MKFNPQDIGAGLLFAMCVVIAAVMATIIGYAAFNASERRAAFEAYTQCLRAVAAVQIAEAKTDAEELTRLRSLTATLVRCTVRNNGSTQVLIAKHMGEDFSRAMRDLGA